MSCTGNEGPDLKLAPAPAQSSVWGREPSPGVLEQPGGQRRFRELEPHNSHLWRNPKQTLKMLPGAAPGAGSATLAEGSHEGGSLGGLAQGPLAAAVPGSKGAGLGVKL